MSRRFARRFEETTGRAEDYVCHECATVARVFRHPKDMERDDGHRKHLYCFECKRITAHNKTSRVGR